METPVKPGPFVLEKDSLRILSDALEKLERGFAQLPALEVSPSNLSGGSCGPPNPLGAGRPEPAAMEEVLHAVAERLRDNYPYFHPLYAGQMMKPPHPVARAAYALAMWINPNNHALDGGRASSQMEKEAVAEIARMFGWESCLGHLCGGGTMANLEALWVAGRLSPGETVVASAQAHYTHQRIGGVLGLNFETIPCDRRGRLEVGALEARLSRGGVGTVVATMGTTATGSVDPLPALLALRERYGFRLHADAAYGGYFVLAENLAPEARAAYDRLGEADSIVIDPHKHGLQPYGCGAVLFRDPSVGRFYKHESPYTYFSSAQLHLGEISLECSRPGAAAVALWATQRLLPLSRGGEFARGIEAGREAALALYGRLKKDERFVTAFVPELDILVWTLRAPSRGASSDLARKVFAQAARRDLHLALADLPGEFFGLEAAAGEQGRVTCLRSVLMKPEHRDWANRLWEILDQATDSVLAASG